MIIDVLYSTIKTNWIPACTLPSKWPRLHIPITVSSTHWKWLALVTQQAQTGTCFGLVYSRPVESIKPTSTSTLIISLAVGASAAKIWCGATSSEVVGFMANFLILRHPPIFSQRILRDGTLIERWHTTNTCTYWSQQPVHVAEASRSSAKSNK